MFLSKRSAMYQWGQKENWRNVFRDFDFRISNKLYGHVVSQIIMRSLKHSLKHNLILHTRLYIILAKVMNRKVELEWVGLSGVTVQILDIIWRNMKRVTVG